MKKIVLLFSIITTVVFADCREHRYLLLENRDEKVLERIENAILRIEKQIDVEDRIFNYAVRYIRDEDKSCYDNYLYLRQVVFFQNKKIRILNEYIDILKISLYLKSQPSLPLDHFDRLELAEKYYLYLEEYLSFIEKELNYLGL